MKLQPDREDPEEAVMEDWYLISDPSREDMARRLSTQEHAFLSLGDVLFEFRARVVDGRGLGRAEVLYEASLEEYGTVTAAGEPERWHEEGYAAVLAMRRHDQPISVKMLLELQYDHAPDAVNDLGRRRVIQDVLKEAVRQLKRRSPRPGRQGEVAA